MPNWDDQFDFQDLDEPKKDKNTNNNNKKKTAINGQDQFFDLDDNPKKKQQKLPTINSRQSANKQTNNKINTSLNNNKNPYADKVFGNKANQNDEDQYNFQQDIADQVPDIKAKQNKNVKSTKIDSNKNLNNNIKNNTKNNDDNYQYDQQFYEQQQIQEFKQQSPKLKNNITKNNDKKDSNIIINHKKSLSLQPEQIIKPTSIFNNNTNTPINKINNKNNRNQNTNNNKNNSNNKVQDYDDYQDKFQQNDQYNDDEFEQQKNSPIKKQKQVPIKNTQSGNLNKQKQDIILTTKAGTIKTNNLTLNSNKQIKQDTKNKKLINLPKPSQVQDQRKNSKIAAISNKNINKIQSSASVNKQLVRNNSRKSIRSTDSKQIQHSRLTTKNQSEYCQNKYTDMVQKSFPHDQDSLNKLSQIDINKLNQKMRGMIRKFNQELNDLINKNMLLLKNKGNQKLPNIQERIKQLQLQKKTGQTAIDVMQKQFQKLQGRQGQLKQQEYQLILQKRIQQKKLQIKQITKQIIDIKRQVDTKGKKLSVKQQQKRDAQSVTHLKTILIQTKKDQQKADQKIQKLTSNQQQLETKIADLDYKLDQLISQAKQKGISVENHNNLMKKYEDSKKKLENLKNFNKKTQTLINTKIDIINHQDQQIRITIRNINSQINNLYGSIDHSQNQSIKIIQKAKQKTGINPVFAQNLDKLMKQIQLSKANSQYYQVLSQASKRSDSAKHKQSRKNNNQVMDKSLPLRTAQSQNKNRNSQDYATVKPKFMKKKHGDEAVLQVQNNHINQRVWTEQLNQNAKSYDPKRTSQQHRNKPQQNKIKHQQPDLVIQQKKDKIKPFMLKKNKAQNKSQNQNSQEYKIQQKSKNQSLTLNIQAPVQAKKQQTVNINIAPRMIKFGKKKNQQNKNDISNVSNSNNQINTLKIEQKKSLVNESPKITLGEQLKLQIKQQVKNQQPIFAPKRFNLRNRAQKKDDSYMPSVQNNNNITLQPQKTNLSVKQQPKVDEYKPKFDFKNEQLSSNTTKPKQQFKINEQIKPTNEQDSKPKFNLRLRDRVKKADNNQGDSYNPTSITSSNKNINDQNKGANNLNINNNNNNNNINSINNNNLNPNTNNILNNPYAPKKVNFGSNNNQNNNNHNESNSNNLTLNNKTNLNNQLTNNTAAVNNPYAPKNNDLNSNNKININNNNIANNNVQPLSTNNQPVNNPYGPKQSTNNPYLPSSNTNLSKLQRGGPLKKNKFSTNNLPKQKINIYDQAEDISNQVSQFGTSKPTQQQTTNNNPYAPLSINNNNNKDQQLDINAMLGIKKQTKKNDFDDLLGDVGTVGKKNKKKNNDFFGDLEL